MVWTGNDASDTLTVPTEARYIRLEVTKTAVWTASVDDGQINVRVEFFGCATTDDVSLAGKINPWTTGEGGGGPKRLKPL